VVEAGGLLIAGASLAAGKELDIELVGDAQIDDPRRAVGFGETQELGEAQLAVVVDRGLKVVHLEVEVSEAVEWLHVYLHRKSEAQAALVTG